MRKVCPDVCFMAEKSAAGQAEDGGVKCEICRYPMKPVSLYDISGMKIVIKHSCFAGCRIAERFGKVPDTGLQEVLRRCRDAGLQ